MLRDLMAALALMLVIEGLAPLCVPAAWRATFQRMTGWADGQIRFAGLLSILAGVLLFTFVR
ncbi:DUF2065 domain-containing protein [Uliginosibacterium paludis]|uniref:DUF2065 domain-containing protein n=1 Tax=Uliginosibacterium paludis TaxID=1615952 RepID=A0ABV2CRB7_9RHOO